MTKTMPNGFQLFLCVVDTEAEQRPFSRLEIKQVLWVQAEEITPARWRFPEQVSLIKRWLKDGAISGSAGG